MTDPETDSATELRWLHGFGGTSVYRARHNLIGLANRPADAGLLINSPGIERMLEVCEVRGRAVNQAHNNRRRFASDVLSLMARNVWARTDFNMTARQMAKDEIATVLDGLATATDRFQVARTVLRKTIGDSFRQSANTPAFLTFLQLSLVPVTLANRIDSEQVRRALDTAENELAGKRATGYLNAIRLFGLRFRHPSATVEDFTLVVSGAMLGMSLRHLISPERLDKVLDWDGQRWHLAALGVTGIIDEWLEPDPDYDAANALSLYLRDEVRTRNEPSQVIEIPRGDS
ncbi:hypothetical protein [Cumulibacter soli]|uniref:hypothetical protein n=1 Tax=Cumulibacter soli TaxID=2546344 RepID=UPI0010683A3A|nr:hypothetical protein [Cumulibacter soli]